jgi:acetate kinase
LTAAIIPGLKASLQGTPAVLAVNAGSSSLKFGLYGPEGPAPWSGQFEGLEPGGAPMLRSAGQPPRPLAPVDGLEGFDLALATLVATLAEAGVPLRAVAHRIVHGGERHAEPCRLDAEALEYLATLNALAPLHQPHNLEAVAAFQRRMPQVPQIGCFDTAFHTHLLAVERRLPIDRALAAQGLRRYGFHGLSYQYVMQVLLDRSPRASGRALLAHLGNGASVCATREGRSIATSMGFSALDGLMMGTRSGSVDPGVLLHLWRQGWTMQQVETLLYKQSGLKGVSGISADMRTLRTSQQPEAQEAIELFTHRLLREAGALLAVLGGVDVIAFTGGIGEHDALLREQVIGALGWTGVRLDAQANQQARGDAVVAIQAPESPIEVWVVPTDEGRVAAQAAAKLVA